MTQKISYQGLAGAYSDLACRDACPDYEPLSKPTFFKAMNAVLKGDSDRAMIPVDNSVAGRVADVHRLLPQTGLKIVGEHFLPIHHCLLGVEGGKIEDITHVFSHVHALPQCEKLIKTLGAEPVVYGDTAQSAKHVADKNEPHRAAIASKQAAETYGLKIFKENVEDFDKNTTRFLVLEKEQQIPAFSPDQKHITSLMFKLRSFPAVLYKCLGGFATNGINLTKLESYTLEGDFEKVQFFCDVEAHPDEDRMRYALEELAFYTDKIESYGTYVAHPYRFLG